MRSSSVKSSLKWARPIWSGGIGPAVTLTPQPPAGMRSRFTAGTPRAASCASTSAKTVASAATTVAWLALNGCPENVAMRSMLSVSPTLPNGRVQFSGGGRHESKHSHTHDRRRV